MAQRLVVPCPECASQLIAARLGDMVTVQCPECSFMRRVEKNWPKNMKPAEIIEEVAYGKGHLA